MRRILKICHAFPEPFSNKDHLRLMKMFCYHRAQIDRLQDHMMPSSTDRIYGSLIGLIFADAVGARFEGLQQEQLRSKFGSSRILMGR